MDPEDPRARSDTTTHLPYLTASPKSATHAGVPQHETKTTATSKPFQYTRLQDKQIRVLRISLDPDTKFLICNFDVRDLTACRGTYRAISYCWGNPKPTCSVLCNTGDYINLTESAAEILKFVLPRYPRDWFWIDQICINQLDLVEKSAQVPMMGQIYSSTKQVIAWLGRGDKDTQRAVAFVEKMYIFLNDMKHKGAQPTLEPFFKTSASLHRVPGQLVELRKWRALTDLLANPWFERVWVVQEVVMAPDNNGDLEDAIILSFDNCTISFEMFATVIQKIQDDHLATELAYDPGSKDITDQFGQYPPGFNAVRIYLIFRKLRREKTESLSMSWALIYTKNFNASDHRDKIYAVMNFADPADLDLKPDYECPLESVYISYATRLIERSDYPLLLHIAGIGLRKSPSTLPSWVPDFSPSPFSVRIRSDITKKYFDASADRPGQTVSVDPCSKTMSFMGIKIDTVELLFRQPSPTDKRERGYSQDTSSIWNPFKAAQKFFSPETDYYASFLNFLNNVEAFLDSSHATPGPKGSTKEAIFYTLIGDYSTGEATVDSDLLEAYEAWHNAYRELAGPNTLQSIFASTARKPEVYGQIAKFEDLIGPPDELTFGTSMRRLLGRGPGGMLPGDSVCIIMGARTPFLLRPDAERIGDARWKLVGPCFVYGLMYGEGLSMGEPEKFVVT